MNLYEIQEEYRNNQLQKVFINSTNKNIFIDEQLTHLINTNSFYVDYVFKLTFDKVMNMNAITRNFM